MCIRDRADGWFPQVPPGRRLDEARAVVDASSERAGRPVLPFEGRVNAGAGGLAQVVDHLDRWEAAGAAGVTVNTMGAGLDGIDEHLAVLREVSAARGLRGTTPRPPR